MGDFWLIKKSDTALIAGFVAALLARDEAAVACLAARKSATFGETVNKFVGGR